MRQQRSEVVVEYLGKKILPMSEQTERVGYFYDVSVPPSQQQDIYHHVVLVDLSWSMKSELTWIKESLKVILKQLRRTKNQTLSILGFADKMTSYGVIREVKSEEINEKLEELELKIDRLVTVCSMGQFSFALQSVIDQLKLTSLAYPSQQLIILTDANWNTIDNDFEEDVTKGLELLTTHQQLFSAIHFLLFKSYYRYSSLQKLIQSIGQGSIKEALNRTTCLQQMRKWVKGDSTTLLIQNNHLFSLSDHQWYKATELLEIRNQQPLILVTFDDTLHINDNDIPLESTDLTVGEEIFNQFRLSYCIYLIRNNRVDEATDQLKQSKYFDLLKHIRNSYTTFERNQSLHFLLRAKQKGQKRGKEESAPSAESLCLLEVIRLIQQDKSSHLWWNHPIDGSQSQNNERYQFQVGQNKLAKVCQIQIGSKKLSIGLKVKVEGQVEDQVTGLKLDAYVFRTFSLLMNGEIVIKDIACQVSSELKQIFQKEKLIKDRLMWKGREMLILNLAKLKVANHRIGTLMSEESIAHSLYEAEYLGCKRLVLKSLINQTLTLKPSQASPKNLKWDLRSKIRRQYGVSDSGMYLAKTSPITPRYHLLGQYVRVIEWKIEGRSRRQALQKAYETYMVSVNEQGNSLLKWLFEELEQVSQKRQQLLDWIHLQKIAMAIIQETPNHWDQEFVKSKLQMDPLLKRNVIHGGKMSVSQKTINQITFRQNAYNVWVSHQELD